MKCKTHFLDAAFLAHGLVIEPLFFCGNIAPIAAQVAEKKVHGDSPLT